MNGATRNTYCLSRSDFELFSVDRPGQHPVDAVNGLFVMVVAMGRSRQALRGRDNNFKCRDAAARVFAGDQEANRERPYGNVLFRRIDFDTDDLLGQSGSLW